MFFWNSLAFLMIQQMLAIWSMVPLPFLKPPWTSGSSRGFFPGGSERKVSACNEETRVWSLGQEDLLQKEMATHSSTLAWKIPWMKKPERLQSMVSQRVGHDWATSLLLPSYLILIRPLPCHSMRESYQPSNQVHVQVRHQTDLSVAAGMVGSTLSIFSPHPLPRGFCETPMPSWFSSCSSGSLLIAPSSPFPLQNWDSSQRPIFKGLPFSLLGALPKQLIFSQRPCVSWLLNFYL